MAPSPQVEARRGHGETTPSPGVETRRRVRGARGKEGNGAFPSGGDPGDMVRGGNGAHPAAGEQDRSVGQGEHGEGSRLPKPTTPAWLDCEMGDGGPARLVPHPLLCVRGPRALSPPGLTSQFGQNSNTD